MEYKAVYKCRLCGARIYGPTFTTSRACAVSYMVNTAAGVRGACLDEPPYRRLHECDDGSLGLAEFLGMEKVVKR